MFANIETNYKKLRRSISRSDWMIRLLGLDSVEPASDSRDQGHPTGLIMIQIDGLARPQFEAALNKGELPFLKKLLTREHFKCHALYSGLPSSTPAVQGELFYGVKGIVPAFGYRRKEDGRFIRMYDPVAAEAVQDSLRANGNPLLDGGSAYCNIYTGGAAESHFCAASMGWDDILKGIAPIKWLMVMLLNLATLIRTLALMVVEFFLAVIDVVRGLIAGKSFLHELKFIAARVFVSILMRDMITIGASMDIARGTPIIHLNYIGYDEQSHRRGPDSAFAHWTLKGIDRCIERLWKISHRYHKRHYDIWVYSDHGQERVIPYQRLRGIRIDESVRMAVDGILKNCPSDQYGKNHRMTVTNAGVNGVSRRANYLDNNALNSLMAPVDEEIDTNTPLTVAMGPVGHVYLDSLVNLTQRTLVARSLVETHQVPAAIVALDDDSLMAYTAQGEYRIPGQENELFGPDHPFLSAVGLDLQSLCCHKDAGDIVLLGCVHNVPAVSFAMENGAHAGAGPNETSAFLLTPGDTDLRQTHEGFIRPIDIHNTALAFLGRSNNKHPGTRTIGGIYHQGDALGESVSGTESTRPLRIMTYNVHRCVGMDNIESPERIARVIARSKPDVIALQELDVSNGRLDQIHQANHIAELLDMELHFHPARVAENELYGDAILTSLPMRLIKADSLPQPAGIIDSEIRGALWVELDYQDHKIQLINTHLGLRKRERLAQMTELNGERWLAHPDCVGPVIMCGDFNALPGSKSLQLLDPFLKDARQTCRGDTAKTFSSRIPLLSIDHIFVNDRLTPTSINVPDSELTRVASDHLPLVAELELKLVR